MKIGIKKFNFEITISVTGEARIYGDRVGDRRAEIEYDAEKMREVLDEALVAKLEKVVWFKNFRDDGRLLLGSWECIGFVSSLKDYGYRNIGGKKTK